MSWWVNAWYHTPWIDRYAYSYMWNHGGWDTAPGKPPAYDAAARMGSQRPHRSRQIVRFPDLRETVENHAGALGS
jgi:hypothetical protein